MSDIALTHVFVAGPGGGNPAPIVLDASGMTEADMQAVAREHGHESGFVLPAPAGSDCDFTFRYWVPNHEMPMCGHVTVGAVWLLNRVGRLPSSSVRIDTRSGVVHARVDNGLVEITQPEGTVSPVDASAVPELLDVLGITADDLADRPIRNARTSRTKTLIPVADLATLDRLRPDFSRVEQVCARLGSTGLYPYAVADSERHVFDARQFPRSSGYPEDAATGIAAAALVYGLLADGLITRDAESVRVRQGRSMGRPSEIVLRFADLGLWLGGEVR
ncbi:PhzF family phenazine biosynthesis protein [Lentzea sp. JNUCC 0626]|uniref:PhzF family phenazine biosynthesis protein n=1 Tax=Lentzea sp. JNUCC 0626 TaxID=3367513 RepID=UPI0037499457